MSHFQQQKLPDAQDKKPIDQKKPIHQKEPSE
jgi:hypothetical protein